MVYRSFQRVNKWEVETRQPKTQELSANSIADSVLTFLFTLPSCRDVKLLFYEKKQKEI